MKIGIAQINIIIGDLKGNTKKILESYEALCSRGAEIVLFPELTISGYSPRDLLYKDQMVKDNVDWLHRIASEIGDVPALVGFIEPDYEDRTRRHYNSAAWCETGEIKVVARKCLLPSYGVFEEDRYFKKGMEPVVYEYKGKRVGITICEDIWTGEELRSHRIDNLDPVKFVADAGVDIVLNLSASPWHFQKGTKRMDTIKRVSRKCECPIAYANFVGGNDEIIFDGRSMVVSGGGEKCHVMASFEEELAVIDTDSMCSCEEKVPCENEEIFKALSLGLSDYAHKIGFERVLLGLSGGIDSAVVAAIAADAMGSENVYGYALPSSISSDHSQADAKALADNLGIHFETLPIDAIVDAAEGTLKGLFKGTERGIAEENIQARARGMLLMALSNKNHGLLLSTGNKSELAVGYCTLYGDMAGGLSVISDVSKMKVYDLANYINREREIIPQNTIDKAPSAELREGQMDQDTLPPYPILDEIVCLYVENHLSGKEIVEKGFDPEVVSDIIDKIDHNEYKRRQAAPGLKITPLAFGIGRRMPVVQKYRHLG